MQARAEDVISVATNIIYNMWDLKVYSSHGL